MQGPNTTSAILPALAAADAERKTAKLEAEIVDLFDQMRDRLLRYAMSFRLGAPDAEEVVQETFLALFQHLRHERSRENLRGWLFRVAHNLSLKRLRSVRRENISLDVEEGAARWHVADPSPSVEDEIVRAQTQLRVNSVMQALSQQDRQCLLLRAEGLKYREISEVLGVSLGSVAGSLERSLARIARAAKR